MADTTGIEWCDSTWSPWEGCTKVSPACDHCYAKRMNDWLRKGENWGAGATRRGFSADHWNKPLRWNEKAARAGRRIKVFPSICDPFDNEVAADRRENFFDPISRTPNIDWLLLTKRVGNARAMIEEAIARLRLGGWKQQPWPWPNVWIGATVCNQEEADRDVPKLLATPATVRFVSIEPMLGPIDVSFAMPWRTTQGGLINRSIDWVIAGGESGPKARPMHPDWVRSLRDQCAAAGVGFFFKQWGEWVEADRDGGMVTATEASGVDVEERRYDVTNAHGAEFIRVGKRAAGRLLDGCTHDGVPRSTTP